jgi:carboxypeptidase PM20D1
MKNWLIVMISAIIFGVLGLVLTATLNKPETHFSTGHYKRPIHSTKEKKGYVERLSQAIQYQTVSTINQYEGDDKPFEEFNRFLFKSFPSAVSKLTLEYTSEYSLLFSLEGQDPSKAPVLLIAHSDVVPAQSIGADSATRWQHQPFSGHIDEQYIWGRGTLDNKSAILAIFEAIEKRIDANEPDPQRTLYIAITHDEEVGGHQGAKRIANFLKNQNIHPYFILDEGQAVTQGIVPNVEKPVALIGVSQKGYMTIELSAKGEPGHSMIPPKATSISKLSNAIDLLTKSPMPTKMTRPVKAMFRQLSHEMEFPNNVILFHTWLSEPMVSSQLEKSPTTDALIRSSMSVNMISGGVAENVLPRHASALMNYRIAPHNSSDEILSHVRKTIAGTGVELRVVSAIEEPTPITNHDHDGYRIIEQSIVEIFPGTVVAPSITLATTDSRHFTDLSPTILRFCPIIITKNDLKRFHGANERISISNYLQMIDFYGRLIDKI